MTQIIDGTRLIGYARVSSDYQNIDMQPSKIARATGQRMWWKIATRLHWTAWGS